MGGLIMPGAIGWLILFGGVACASGPRMIVGTDQYPWSSVGKVYNGTGAACTGILVGTRSAITAAHCLYARQGGRLLPPSAIHFLLGYDRGRYRVHARVLHYKLGLGYDVTNEAKTIEWDWALLTLSDQIFHEQPVALSSQAGRRGAPVALAGFQQAKPYILTADTSCRIEAVRGHLLLSSCAARHGDSGGALLTKTEAGEEQLLGLQVGIAKSRTGESVGLAISVHSSPLGDAIREALRAPAAPTGVPGNVQAP